MAPSYVIQRALYAVPIAIGVTVICFALIYLGPVDPVAAVTPDDATPEQIAMIRAAYGFDRPLPVQYFTWLGHVAHGGSRGLDPDGTAGRGASSPGAREHRHPRALCDRLQLHARIWHGRAGGELARSLARPRPERGRRDRRQHPELLVRDHPRHRLLGRAELAAGDGHRPWRRRAWAWDFAHLKHLILPVVAISMIPIGVLARTTRAAVLEILSQRVRRGAARPRPAETAHHASRPPQRRADRARRRGLQFGQMLGGSILIETIFAWPGSGFLLYQAIFKRDLPVLQGTIAVIALLFVAINLAWICCRAGSIRGSKGAEGARGVLVVGSTGAFAAIRSPWHSRSSSLRSSDRRSWRHGSRPSIQAPGARSGGLRQSARKAIGSEQTNSAGTCCLACCTVAAFR